MEFPGDIILGQDSLPQGTVRGLSKNRLGSPASNNAEFELNVGYRSGDVRVQCCDRRILQIKAPWRSLSVGMTFIVPTPLEFHRLLVDFDGLSYDYGFEVARRFWG